MPTATELADDYRAAVDETIDFAQTCTPEQWEAATSEEGWTVAATIHHVALGNERVAGWIEALRAGDAVEGSPAEQDEDNAAHAAEFAAADRGQTLTLLESSAADLEALIRSLSAGDLAASAAFGPAAGAVLSVAQAAGAATGHIRHHLDSAQAAAGIDS
jgi:uncharacterized damage-inducible protein DinB